MSEKETLHDLELGLLYRLNGSLRTTDYYCEGSPIFVLFYGNGGLNLWSKPKKQVVILIK
jgi:hypothetical protein